MPTQRLMQDLELTATDWHDGRLKGVTYSVSDGGSEVVLSLEVYSSVDATERHAVSFKFISVADYTVSALGSELQAHAGPGNIVQGRLNENDSGRIDLSVYLTGAYIRILADAVERCEL